MPPRKSDVARRYVALVQDSRGYPPRNEPLPDDAVQVTVHTVVLAEDYERLLREAQNGDGPCGLCGGYGAWSPGKQEAVPCMSCGEESTGLVLVATEDVARPLQPSVKPQIGGLRLIEGGDQGA